MSRQNKVNPGMYTQRGRLTQDESARELAKQRAIGSEHTWQPVKRDQQPRPMSEAEGADDDSAGAEPVKTAEKKPARVIAKAKPARKTAKAPAKTAVRAKKAKAKSAKRRKS